MLADLVLLLEVTIRVTANIIVYGGLLFGACLLIGFLIYAVKSWSDVE